MIGGFPSGLPLVLSGPAGSGRTVFAIELAHHALARGEPVSILSTESAPSLLRGAASLDFAFEAALDDDRLAILELHTGAPALLREHGVADLVQALRGEIAGRTLVVIDPISALLCEIADESRLRELVRELVRSLEGHDLVLTLEEERPTHRVLEVVVTELCGAFLRLEREPGGRRTISLERTRTGVSVSERLAFAIGSGGVQIVEDGSPDARPQRVRPAPPRREAVVPPPAAEGRRPLVLVADDDRLLRTILTEWLSSRYEVIAVADGFEALSSLVSRKPDLVILDLVMPRVSGYEFLYSMRRSGFDVPVLVASSHLATQGARLGPLVLGATDFLSKPLSRVELMHKVDTLLRLPRTREPRFGEADAEQLFASFSGSRRLEIGDFAARVERACEFGDKYDVPSSILALVAEHEADLDRWLEVADRELRFEDAILRVDKRLALVLCVATAPQYAPRVAERLAACAEAGEALPKLATEVWLAERCHAAPEALNELAYELLGGSRAQ